MKYLLIPASLLLILLLSAPLKPAAQELQLQYDARHTLDPAHTTNNFPSLYFQYFKPAQDSSRNFIKLGSFLMKTETDLEGDQHNIGKSYIQVSQSFRAWQPKVYLSLEYSGGLGVTDPVQYSYYIVNNYSVGAELPFHSKATWFDAQLYYKYAAYPKPSNDFLYTFYWWKGLFHYRVELAGDFSIWTENKNHGDEETGGMAGKRFFFFAEPQVWYKLNKTLAVGSRINMYYNVNIPNNVYQCYPTIGVRWKL